METCFPEKRFDFQGSNDLTNIDKFSLARQLTSCLLLALASGEVPARTGDRVEERRCHFLLLLPEVLGGGGGGVE